MSLTRNTCVLVVLVAPLACDRESTGTVVETGKSALFEDIKDVPKDSSAAEPVQVKVEPAGPVKSGSEPLRGVVPSLLTAPVGRRYVAIFDKTVAEACPNATTVGWSGDRLFRSGDALALMTPKDATLPLPLERFCRYTWGGKGAPATGPQFDAAWTAKLIRIDADLDVTLPQTASYLGADPVARGELSSAFRMRLGAVGSGTPSTVHQQTEAGARVAVVDTAGFGDAATAYASARANLRHGLTMAEIVADVRCPNGEAQCRDKQFLAQAFPYVGGSPLMQTGGGPLGSIGSLAYAVGEAVVRWQSLKLPAAPLIINLSVAWDPRFGHALTTPGQEAQHTQLLVTPSATVPATVQAVHAILVYASCLDALAIAAAGNNTGGPCEQVEAMAPARWESYPAPDAARCEALFGTLPARRGGDPGFKMATVGLVVAAGGVIDGSTPIPVARVGSTPARVLPAFQAVAGAGSRQTDAWTGTSVAAAAMSGLAASVWTHAPTMTPAQVVSLITSSGEATSLNVEMIAGGGQARRVSGHATFNRLCLNRAGCVNPYAPPQMPVIPGPAAETTSVSENLTCAPSTVSCGAQSVTVHACGAAGASAPPPAPEPWLRPQPGTPICPICPVRGGKLTVSLNPDHGGSMAVLNNPTFEFRTASGSYVRAGLGQITVDAAGTIVDLARYTITAGAAPQTIADALAANQVTAATLAFYINDAAGNPTRASSSVSVSP